MTAPGIELVLSAFLISVALAVTLTPAVRHALVRYELVDRPNTRSSHVTPTPRGGGIAVGIAAAAALIGLRDLRAVAAVAGSASLLGIVGFADDRHGLRPRARLAAQVLVALGFLPLLLRGMTFDQRWTWVFGLGVVAWWTTYVNAFNFMDGINGMAVAQTVVAGIGLAVMGVRWDADNVAVLGTAIAGAAVGFAPYNVPSARLFLGDVGSYFIGSWLATTGVIALRAGVPPELVVAPFLLCLIDTGSTLWSRWRRGASITAAHREHAYQRLVQLGWGHTTVSVLAGVTMTSCTLIALAVAKSPPVARAMATGLTVLIATGFVYLPTLLKIGRHPVST